MRSDFSLRFVAEHTAKNLPPDFRIAALWTGPAGAVLFTALVASACATAAAVRSGQPPPLGERPFALIMLAAALLVLLSLSALALPPFERLAFLPLEGRGMAPHFQSVAAAVQPAIALVAAAVLLPALALTVEALLRRRGDRESWRPIAQWIFGAWLLQSVACALGIWLFFHEPTFWSHTRGLVLRALVPWIATTLSVCAVARWRVAFDRRIAWLCVSAGAFIVAGLAASAQQRRHDVTLGAGHSRTLRDAFNSEWTFAQQGISVFRVANRDVLAATIEGQSASGRQILLAPERQQFIDSAAEQIFAPKPTLAVDLGLLQDVEAQLIAIGAGDAADLQITFRPLASLLWTGCALLFLGSALAWIRSLKTTA
ncbi:MAG: hypothetical protein ACT4P6_12970 [Gemmatimonadaceae bacterium]